MKNIPASVTAHIEETAAKLKKYPKLEKLYRNCYPNTLETTAEVLEVKDVGNTENIQENLEEKKEEQ